MKKYSEYKDSRIEWIGEIPEHWLKTKLKYYISIQSGKGITNENLYQKGLYPVYGGNGVLGCTDNYTSDTEDIIIGRVGALCGNIRLVAGKKWISDNALVANTSENYLFFEYLLTSLNLNNLASKNAQPLITGTIVKEQLFVLPPKVEQTAIANYLDRKTAEIDTLIEKKQQLIQLYKEERTATISQAVTKGLDPNVPMKDSGIEWLGEIPEHWEVGKLKYFTKTISKGTTPSTVGKEVLSEGPVRFLKAENIFNNELQSLPSFFIDNDTDKVLRRSKLLPEDVLIVIAGATIGKVAVVNKEFSPSNTNQAVCFIRLTESYKSRFLWYWLKSYYIKEKIQFDATQAAQPNLSMENIGRFGFPKIDEVETRLIIDYLDKEFEKLIDLQTKAEQEIELLKEYKTALISEVVLGKVDVREEQLD